MQILLMQPSMLHQVRPSSMQGKKFNFKEIVLDKLNLFRREQKNDLMKVRRQKKY